MSLRELMIWLGALGLLWGGMPLVAGPFVPPAEGVTPIRRDRLPLDVDAMRELSQQLGSLAKGQGGTRPEDRRAAAQLVALALAVQPENRAVRKFSEQFRDGDQQAQGDAIELAATRARVWETLAWLESPAAGAAGQALAACLGDVVATVDPKHPRAVELLKKGEQGAWRDWVKPLEAFTSPAPRVENPALNPPDQVADTTAAGDPIRLAKAVVTTVLWTAGEKAGGGSAMRPLPIGMAAKLRDRPDAEEDAEDEEDKKNEDRPPLGFSCFWTGEKSHNDGENFRVLGNRVKAAVELGRAPLPAGMQVVFSPGNRLTYVFDQDRSAISGAMAVLLRAAVTGVEPHATVIGEIGMAGDVEKPTNGSFKLPSRFWERLRALATGPGGRLVLPTEAAAYLPSILALEEPGFFLKYEVLLAANLEELQARSAKKPEGELAEISARFIEIGAKLGTQAVPGYVANRLVRQQLDEIGRTAPFHASARMLAIQGAGKRPTTLPRAILATELLMAVRPMAWVPKEDVDELETAALNETFEACKKNVARLERYTEARDRDLADLANDLVTDVRTLARALRTKVDANWGEVSHERDFEAFKRSYEKVTETLKTCVATF